MPETMTGIELGGVPGRTFSKVHYRSITRTQEAAKALAATIQGFESFMITRRKRGITFSVFMKNILIECDLISGLRR